MRAARSHSESHGRDVADGAAPPSLLHLVDPAVAASGLRYGAVRARPSRSTVRFSAA